MKVAPLQPSTTFGLDPNAATQESKAKTATGAVDGKPPIDPQKLRLAQEFEQIFIRKMLSSLEKTGHNQAGPKGSSGSDAYGSMVVSALAEAVSKGGGVGLAEVIARAASQPLAAGPASDAGTTAAVQSAIANATGKSSGMSIGASAAHLTVPQNVRITVSHPPTGPTYARPSPTPIINENNDIHDLFKDPNR